MKSSTFAPMWPETEQRLFWCIFASATCLIIVQSPPSSSCGNGMKSYWMSLFTFSHLHSKHFPPRQHNLPSERWALEQNMTRGFISCWSVYDVGGFLLSWLAYTFFELTATWAVMSVSSHPELRHMLCVCESISFKGIPVSTSEM